MAEPLQAADFEPHVGKVLRFEGARHALPLDRMEVSPHDPSPGMPRKPFILIFRGPKEVEVLPASLYAAQVEGGPTFGLYVMPIHTPQPDRQEYQAIFN